MNIRIDENAKAAVIEPTGDLVVGVSTCLFREMVYEILNKKINHIVVDLRNVRQINSLCIGALIGGFTSVKNAGGELKLANANERVKEVLSVTKLDKIFHFYNNIDEAVSSF